MKFDIQSSEDVPITDLELSDLLQTVYVNDGYTPPDLASTLFEPSSVRKRGVIFTARRTQNASLAGMVIVVPPHSNARVIARDTECEMHLLGVKSEYRSFGVGRRLVDAIIAEAQDQKWAKMVLWTQENMVHAQRLYESCGFARKGRMFRNDMNFIIYERNCT